MAEKTILHCDLNSFFASVELKENPSLRGKAVAVCGSKEERHGIVLAKTEQAKRFGVKTGEAIWQAEQKCSDLIIVPPHYDLYTDYSMKVRKIYYGYTNLVESFGIDECWLDVTGSKLLFGDGERIANTIRERVYAETGLTISVGVSFNKVFAKLGSDLKKPNAVTVISKNEFKEKIWPLNADEMIGIGRATSAKLKKYGIYTIGQLANCDVRFCLEKFGVIGRYLWENANGLGSDRVGEYNQYAPIKSVGRGSTFKEDLLCDNEVWNMICYLGEEVAQRLRKDKLCASGVQLTVKNEELESHDMQGRLNFPSQCYTEICSRAYELFVQNYNWDKNVRSLTVRAINLIPENEPYQIEVFFDEKRRDKAYAREVAMDNIRKRYGASYIESAALFYFRKESESRHFNSLPSPTFGYM